ncbi:MAG: hypothetical protein PVG24_01635 [Gammaproteobacteria bacterium]|jgi:hypothetical protein
MKLILETREDYRWALERVSELRGLGAMAETNPELAALEGAIARYVARPGHPDERKARPGEDGSDAM